MALTDKLTAIGNAIREKTGGTELLTLDQMATQIASITTGGGSVEVEPIVLSGDCSYACSGSLSSKFIELFGDKITTNKITSIIHMFDRYKATDIPFELNINNGTYHSCSSLFEGANNLEVLPIMNNFYPSSIDHMFFGCSRLRTIPENVFNNWNYSKLHSYNYAGIFQMFQACYSLRNIPESFLKNMYSAGTSTTSTLLYGGFNYCCCLDEIRGINFNLNVNITSNVCSWGFNNCNRVKDIIFDCNEDGSPKIINAKQQTIDLTTYVGYANFVSDITGWNSGITANKLVKDDATYQALKNDPDWFAADINYSRYNHDSAVRTINSLPDTSAYLATAGGTNTIKFKGQSGALTDGGAINTLTEEEIAVATAKGWTVSLV